MLADWVKETVSAGGTGDLTLGGAPAGYIRFSDAFPLGYRFYYVIEDGNNREAGVGYLSDTTTLVRERIHQKLESGVFSSDFAAGLATGLNVTTSAVVAISAVRHGLITAPPYKPGSGPNNTGSYHLTGTIADGGTPYNITANRLYYVPFLATEDFTATSGKVRIYTGVSGSVGAVGLYYMKADGLPGAKFAETAQFATETAGLLGGSLSPSVTLKRGDWIYVAFACTGGVKLHCMERPLGVLSPLSFQAGGSYERSFLAVYEDLSPGWTTLPDTPTISYFYWYGSTPTVLLVE